MKERLKNELLANLSVNMSAEQLKMVATAFDIAAAGFDVKSSETALILYDNELMNAVKNFVAVRKTEGLAMGTIEGYWLILKRFAETIGKPLKSITISDVRLWFYAYQQSNGISDRTKNHLEGIVKNFFSWMVDEGYIDRDIMRPYKRTKYQAKQKEALSQMNLEKLLDAAKGDTRGYCVLMLLYATGCRAAEMAGIRLSDINIDKGEIVVTGKGNKTRTVYFEGRSVIALKAWLIARPSNMGDYLFPGRWAGRHVNTKTLLDIVKHYAAASGCPSGTTTHTLRHTTATIALNRGCPVQDVQKMLGHTNIATTMIYAQVSENGVRASHERCIV